jgi:hypothetical protein
VARPQWMFLKPQSDWSHANAEACLGRSWPTVADPRSVRRDSGNSEGTIRNPNVTVLSPSSPQRPCWVPGTPRRVGILFRKTAGPAENLSAAYRKYGAYRRSPGPPLGRLAPAPTLRAGTRCRLARTPGRPPQTGGLRAGDGLAGHPCAAWVWRSVSGRPGGPGSLRLMHPSSYLCPRVLSTLRSAHLCS